jgi:cell division septation protein DedD
VSLSVAPPNIVLDGPKSRQRLLVTGVRQDGTLVDLSGQAKYSSSTPKVVSVTPAGVAQPVADGAGKIAISAAGKSLEVKLASKNVGKPFEWSFSNHVISVLSKGGCSMGACHGAAAGKNGFRLTLRGYDPDLDYERLMREGGSRRLQRNDPGNSLLLKKATLSVPHAGGQRFATGSLEYQVVADWMASGMTGPKASDPSLVRLEVLPAERTLQEKAEQQLAVRAHFTDGHTEDVTHWARYSSNEESVLSVDEAGKVKVQGVGETAITVMYLDKVTFARMTVPFPNKVSTAQYQAIPTKGKVDQLVLAKLQTLRLLPSDLASDEEFFRRVYLDCIGTLPTAAEVRAFLSDKSPSKRAALVDQLLERPEYVDYWTYKWGDLLRVNRETLTEKGMWTMYSWVRDAVAQNKPWDKLVYDVLTSNGSTFTDGPSNFYRISRTPEDLTETVSQAFLGIRVQCARCHNHPFEKWTQADYYKFANLLSRIGRKPGDHPQDLVITAATSGDIAFPKTGKPFAPAPYDGKPMAADSKEDRRVYLAKWLASGDNPYFVRSIVNRVWRHFMGRGLIEPVDDLRATNPASNEPLMEFLSSDLVAHGFDLKHLMRQIMNSRTYQLTSRPRPENKKDDRQYSRYFVRRLTAEQLLDGICQVTGQTEKFANLPTGHRAIQLPDTRVANYFLDVFGRPPRQITCDCERAQEPNMAQALHLINGQPVNQKISANGGTVDTLLKSSKKDDEIVTELYLSCFGRFPTKQEMDAATQTIKEAMTPPKPAAAAPAKPAESKPTDPKAADAKATDPKAAAKPAEKPAEPPKFDPVVARRQVFEDLLWALINGKEFVFNH